VRRGTEPPLDVYLARAEGARPLVVFVQGSRVVPLFELIAADGAETTLRSALPFDVADLLSARSLTCHLAFLERRGLRSFQVAAATSGIPQGASAGVSKPDRVSDVADAVSALAAEEWVSQVLLVGHSEGADVAAGVTQLLGPRIAAVALLAGAGPSQLFDFVAAARRTADDEGVRRAFEDILWLSSSAASGDYRGLPVERWTSFALESSPLEDLQGCAVPVFVAHGTDDDAASIEGADVFVVELMRRNRERPVFYLVLPELNHRFVSRDGRSSFADVLWLFLEWASGSASKRAIQVGLGTAKSVAAR
jgi:alpha-beta hydrolase superfamily lysophospholipase